MTNFIRMGKAPEGMPRFELKKKFTIFCALVSLSQAQAYTVRFANETVSLKMQQQNSISGQVNDENGMPLPGATVSIRDTKIGTITDFDGKFTLKINADSKVLVISSVGYQTQELPIGNRTEFNISLKPSSEGLDEVVVVGYGTQKKINLTGAVSSMNVSDVKDIPASNTATLLQGRMSGITVSSVGGQPGNDDPQIRIRGIGSFNAGQEPLIIVDGVQSQLSQVPVNDIESISVLKDAASAAIYGVRAANGVVLITTKRGKEGKTKVTIRNNIAFQTPTVSPDFLPSYEWAKIKNMWTVADGGNPVYTEAQIQAMKDGSDPDHFANVDWWDETTQTGVLQTTSAQISGGTEKVRYMVSAEYLDQDGIVIATNALRKSLRSNLDAEITDKFKVGLNLFGYNKDYNEPSMLSASNPSSFDNNLIYQIRRGTLPTVPVKYTNGNYGFVDGLHPDTYTLIKNTVWAANTGFSRSNQFWVEGKLSASYEFFPGLKFATSLANIRNQWSNKRFIPTYEQYDADGNVVNLNINNSLSQANSVFTRYIFENLLTYEKKLNEHTINVLLGSTKQKESNSYTYAYIQNFPNNSITELDAGTTNPQVSGNAYDVALLSYFGRLNYVFDDKYLFEANLRYDGSSRMPKSERYGLFPSFSTGWVISKENFLKESAIISFLKLRASWGQLGNQEIGNYSYVQTYSTGNDYILGGAIAGGVAMNNFANSNIKWETTTITDIGLDANFFNNSLQINADYFNKISSDILVTLPVPGSLGASAPYQNAAKVSNKGWELSVKYQKNIGNINYYVGANCSQVKNNIEDIAGLENWISGNSINLVGNPINAYYGYVADGLYSEDELATAPTQFGNALRAGDVKYKDISGPNGVPDGKVDSEYDRTIIGNPFPKLTYGFNFGVSYKGLDVNAFFQGLEGIKRFNWFNTENVGNFTSSILDYWTEENTDANYPRFGNGGNNYAMSSYWLKDASYLRLKNVEIGYSLPQSFVEKLAMSEVRFYVQGANLLTWSKMKEYDPEIAAGDTRNASFPNTKTYSLGVNISF